MVQRSSNWVYLLLLSILFCLFSSPKASAKLQRLHLTFYMHDRQLIDNSTGVIVAAQGGNLTRYDFGTLIVIDDPITASPSNTSTQLGRGQGMYLVESTTGFHLLVSFSAFLEPPHLGPSSPAYPSSIVFHGSYQALRPSRELPIVAGTGAFRGATGHAIVSTATDYGLYVVLKFACVLTLPATEES